MREKTKVEAIQFALNEDGTYTDYVDVKLSSNGLDEYYRLRANYPTITIVDHGDWNKPERKAQKSDLTQDAWWLLLLVRLCCMDYLKGLGPESLDMFTCERIAELSERFDWEGAGYGPETNEGERVFELTDRIAHFWCIG